MCSRLHNSTLIQERLFVHVQLLSLSFLFQSFVGNDDGEGPDINIKVQIRQ